MNSTSPLNQLASFFEPKSIVWFTTIAADGRLHSRPMMVQEVDMNGNLRFFMSRTSHPVIELTANPNVSISYHEGSAKPRLAISGHASEDPDRSHMNQWWLDEYLTWFPLGIIDPDLALIRVAPLAAEIWNQSNQHHFHLS